MVRMTCRRQGGGRGLVPPQRQQPSARVLQNYHWYCCDVLFHIIGSGQHVHAIWDIPQWYAPPSVRPRRLVTPFNLTYTKHPRIRSTPDLTSQVRGARHQAGGAQVLPAARRQHVRVHHRGEDQVRDHGPIGWPRVGSIEFVVGGSARSSPAAQSIP